MSIPHVRDRVVLRDQLVAYRNANDALVALRTADGHVSAECADPVRAAVEELSSADHGLLTAYNKGRDCADRVDCRRR